MNDDNDATETTETTENDDRHVDIDVMFMSRSELRDYHLSLRPSMNDFLKSNEEKYSRKPKEVCVDTIENKTK
jgi:hypothetical protein